MNIKIGNSYVVGDVAEIEFKKLKPTNQILLFEEQYHDEFDVNLDNITKMVFLGKALDVFYKFICNPSSIEINSVENKSFSVYFRSRENIGKNFLLLPDDSVLEVGESTSVLNVNDDDKRWGHNRDLFQFLYNECFSKEDHCPLSFIQERRLDFENGTFFNLAMEFTDETIISFVISHKFDFEHKFWETDKDVVFVHKNGDITSLDSDYFDELYDFFKQRNTIFREKFNVFDKIIESSYLTPEDIIQDKAELDKLSNLMCDVFSKHFMTDFRYKLQGLFKPIHEEKELGLQFYPSGPRHRDSILTIKNGIVKNHFDSDEDKNGLRIAEAKLHFLRSSQALNPEDGYFYINGKKAEDYYSVDYKDEGGMICRYKEYDRRGTRFYILKINGYYILANNYNQMDVRDVSELEDRKDMMDFMSSQTPIFKAEGR